MVTAACYAAVCGCAKVAASKSFAAVAAAFGMKNELDRYGKLAHAASSAANQTRAQLRQESYGTVRQV
jgi:hypothetical protein